jgi:hypothetical protein
VPIASAVRVDRKAHAGTKRTQHGLDAVNVVGKPGAANLDLEPAMPLPHGAAHFLAQPRKVIRTMIVAPAGVNRGLAG